jgi:hypothetical protein
MEAISSCLSCLMGNMALAVFYNTCNYVIVFENCLFYPILFLRTWSHYHIPLFCVGVFMLLSIYDILPIQNAMALWPWYPIHQIDSKVNIWFIFIFEFTRWNNISYLYLVGIHYITKDYYYLINYICLTINFTIIFRNTS